MRLIDADKHIEYLNAKRDVCLRFDDVLGAQIYQVAIDEIKGADSIDAEPVVKCRDCRYGTESKQEPKDYFVRCIHNPFYPEHFHKNHYCGFGAKKDKEL